MMIIPIDPAQNIYVTDAGFELVATQDVLFEGRTVAKHTYRDSRHLIWKIFQVALAALCTLMTLGLALCWQRGLLWKETRDIFKDRVVYLNIAVQPALQGIISSNSKPTAAQAPATLVPVAVTPLAHIATPTAPSSPSPVTTPPPAAIVPVAVTPPVPAVAPPAQPSPAAIALQQKIKGILKDNPEYGKAVLAWEKDSVSLTEQVKRLEELKQYGFGTDKWGKYFGDIVGAVPLLPDDIYQIIKIQDYYEPYALVKDTHVLVLVPEAVEVRGKRFDITFENLEELAKTPIGSGHTTRYYHFDAPGFENIKVTNSHWVLMRKEIIPGSGNQPFAKQIDMVKEYSQQVNVQYSVPNAIDAVTCCFMTYVSSGIRLFEEKDSSKDYSLTRCQDLVWGIYPSVVGCFSSRGLMVSENGGDSDQIGVSAARTF